ncbi:MAG: DUF4194 domain-containing protein [Burkholderiaceae bacterium]|nr:DUF4194 domain-containing protein [Burkholderiaceae bacterium]
MEEPSFEPGTAAADLSPLVITLLKGVIYRDGAAPLWNALAGLQARVRDYVAVLGLELVLDEAEGYAFLRARTQGDDDASAPLPRLVARRPLTFMVSLLLALLRKKLAEFDASGGDTRLVLTRDEIAGLLRVFLPESSNEARVTDQIDTHLKKIVELGFLKPLKTGDGKASGPSAVFEVRRILKAYVDAQWLADLEGRLATYQNHLGAGAAEADDE